MNSKMIEKVIKIIRRFIDISNLTSDELEDLISDTILSLITAYRKYNIISPRLELKIVKGAVYYFLKKLKVERILKETLRKEVMKFLRVDDLDRFIENKEEKENGS